MTRGGAGGDQAVGWRRSPCAALAGAWRGGADGTVAGARVQVDGGGADLAAALWRALGIAAALLDLQARAQSGADLAHYGLRSACSICSPEAGRRRGGCWPGRIKEVS
jgi:hypothetical protein